jgi:hypothetical protein
MDFLLIRLLCFAQIELPAKPFAVLLAFYPPIFPAASCTDFTIL